MSVCNLIVQPDAAYLVTDEGFFRRDGRIMMLAPKSILIEGLPLAIGATGHGLVLASVAMEVEARLHAKNFTRDGFCDLVRSVYENGGFDHAAHKTRWAIVYYSKRNARPVGYSFFTDPADEDGRTWLWHPTRVLVMPYVEPIGVWGNDVARDITDPAIFDPMRDAMKFIHAQRASRNWENIEGCGVAGQIRLSKVTSSGVEEFLLHDFKDQVGEVAGTANS